MWARIKDFYNSNKYAIWWTVGYVAACWVIMRYMFNFDIFSATRWNQLWHAHLYGFAGFVFGILILATIPLYIATTIVVARTRAPLFNFKLKIPEFILKYLKNAFTQTPMAESDTTTPQTESSNEQAPQENQNSSESNSKSTDNTQQTTESIPAELRVAYARARDNIARAPISAFDLGRTTASVATPVAETAPTENAPFGELSIPTDFDIADTENIVDTAPIFQDVNFDDTDDENDIDDTAAASDIKTVTDENEPVIKYMESKSIRFDIIDDIVVTDKFAIASHTDSDFWVADTESWFAAGKIRKSPIASVLGIAKQYGVQPVLYLASDNIMDIGELRTGWESAGICVISDLDELK